MGYHVPTEPTKCSKEPANVSNSLFELVRNSPNPESSKLPPAGQQVAITVVHARRVGESTLPNGAAATALDRTFADLDEYTLKVFCLNFPRPGNRWQQANSSHYGTVTAHANDFPHEPIEDEA